MATETAKRPSRSLRTTPRRRLRMRVGAEAGTGFGSHVARGDLFATLGAGEAGLGDLAAGVVAQDDGGAARVGQMLVAPSHEHHDCSEEIAADVGEPVLIAFGLEGVRDPLEPSRVDKHSYA